MGKRKMKTRWVAFLAIISVIIGYISYHHYNDIATAIQPLARLSLLFFHKIRLLFIKWIAQLLGQAPSIARIWFPTFIKKFGLKRFAKILGSIFSIKLITILGEEDNGVIKDHIDKIKAYIVKPKLWWSDLAQWKRTAALVSIGIVLLFTFFGVETSLPIIIISLLFEIIKRGYIFVVNIIYDKKTEKMRRKIHHKIKQHPKFKKVLVQAGLGD